MLVTDRQQYEVGSVSAAIWCIEFNFSAILQMMYILSLDRQRCRFAKTKISQSKQGKSTEIQQIFQVISRTHEWQMRRILVSHLCAWFKLSHASATKFQYRPSRADETGFDQ
jgi:hypothetical protein